MISFKNDYSEGACEAILELMQAENREQHPGYGTDAICEEARKLILEQIDCPQAAVHFLVGGTQTNRIVIANTLRPYEAVIAVETGHINTHETGAIESSGHKVIAVAGKDGKILPEAIEQAVAAHPDEHMVKPAMVYISNATEIGTIYTEQELAAVSAVCRKLGLKLFVDGARLGSALTAQGNDLTLEKLAELCDVFYIGGTKNGALFGEAVVITNPELDCNFRYMMKQSGALLAKGWLLGLQFLGLFRDETFFKLAAHANAMADQIRAGLKKAGIPLLTETPTNQIFPILENKKMEALSREVAFETWEKADDTHTVIRLVTSWATTQEQVDELLRLL